MKPSTIRKRWTRRLRGLRNVQTKVRSEQVRAPVDSPAISDSCLPCPPGSRICSPNGWGNSGELLFQFGRPTTINHSFSNMFWHVCYINCILYRPSGRSVPLRRLQGLPGASECARSFPARPCHQLPVVRALREADATQRGGIQGVAAKATVVVLPGGK